MQTSPYSPSSQLSDYSDPPSSHRLATDNLSVILNIDKTVAKSRQIIQESLEVSRKNNERRQQLEERLKSIVSQSESSRTDIIPRGYEEDREGRWKSGAEDSRERGKISDLKQCYEEETGEREKAELQVAELRSKLQRYERFETEYEKIKTELKEVREELKREQGKNRDFADFGSAKTQKLRENIEDLEGLIRRLKLDFERCKEDNLQLERSIKTADEQRSELLKECELLRQTLADLKKLHLRELEEMEKTP